MTDDEIIVNQSEHCGKSNDKELENFIEELDKFEAGPFFNSFQRPQARTSDLCGDNDISLEDVFKEWSRRRDEGLLITPQDFSVAWREKFSAVFSEEAFFEVKSRYKPYCNTNQFPLVIKNIISSVGKVERFRRNFACRNWGGRWHMDEEDNLEIYSLCEVCHYLWEAKYLRCFLIDSEEFLAELLNLFLLYSDFRKLSLMLDGEEVMREVQVSPLLISLKAHLGVLFFNDNDVFDVAKDYDSYLEYVYNCRSRIANFRCMWSLHAGVWAFLSKLQKLIGKTGRDVLDVNNLYLSAVRRRDDLLDSIRDDEINGLCEMTSEICSIFFSDNCLSPETAVLILALADDFNTNYRYLKEAISDAKQEIADDIEIIGVKEKKSIIALVRELYPRLHKCVRNKIDLDGKKHTSIRKSLDWGHGFDCIEKAVNKGGISLVNAIDLIHYYVQHYGFELDLFPEHMDPWSSIMTPADWKDRLKNEANLIREKNQIIIKKSEQKYKGKEELKREQEASSKRAGVSVKKLSTIIAQFLEGDDDCLDIRDVAKGVSQGLQQHFYMIKKDIVGKGDHGRGLFPPAVLVAWVESLLKDHGLYTRKYSEEKRENLMTYIKSKDFLEQLCTELETEKSDNPNN